MGTMGGGAVLGDTEGVTAIDGLAEGVRVGEGTGVGRAVDEGVTPGVGASAPWAGPIAVTTTHRDTSAGIPMRIIGLARNIRPSSPMGMGIDQSRLAESSEIREVAARCDGEVEPRTKARPPRSAPTAGLAI